MDLRQLKAYLIEHKQATLMDLANHFRTEPDLIQGMLTHWIRKGKVEHTHIEECSKGCCKGGNLDIYHWVEEQKQASAIPPIVQA